MVWSKSLTSFFCTWKLDCPVQSVEEPKFSPLNGLGTLSKSDGHRYRGLLIYSQFYCIVLPTYPVSVPHCFTNCSFVLSFEIRRCESSNCSFFSFFFLSFFEDFFWLFWVLAIPYEFRDHLFHFWKKICNFDRDCVYSVDNFS